MSDNKKQALHTALSIVIAVLVCAVGILLITSCIDIYKSGYRLFSPETVSASFSKIAAPIYILLALIIGGIFVNIFLPLEKKPLKASVSDRVQIRNLTKKIDFDLCDADTKKKLQLEKNLRLATLIVLLALVLLGTIFSLVFALNLNNYPYADANIEVLTVFLSTLRYLLIPFTYAIIASYVLKFSLKRELSLLKEAIKSAKTSAPVSKITKKEPHKAWSIVPVCVFVALGAAFVILGIFNGGANDVISKAVKICTECIGLG